MRRLGPVLLIFCGLLPAQRAAYEGPTILSRGVGAVLRSGSELVRIRPFVSLHGVYDSNLTAVSLDEQGNIPQVDAFGVEAAFGALGYHSWRRTVLGLDYRGSARHYSRESFHDGSDHALTLGLTHQVSRNVAFSLREAAGSYSRSYGVLNAQGFFDPAFAGVPSNELFDGRTHYLSTMGDMTIAAGRRLSFNMGGSGLVVRRRSAALVGVTGWSGRGDVAYQVGRNHALGVDYDFTHWEFTRLFGASDLHTLAVNWAAKLGRRWDFGIRAGASRVESLGLRRVAIDPVVAAILGQTTGIEAFYTINYIPAADVRLSRVFQRSNLSLAYTRGGNPGNGFYGTSQHESAGIHYSHSLLRTWSFGLNAGYDRYKSLYQNIGKYESYHGGGGLTYQITRALHFRASVDARRYKVARTILDRNQVRATVGFAYSPGEFPLSLW